VTTARHLLLLAFLVLPASAAASDDPQPTPKPRWPGDRRCPQTPLPKGGLVIAPPDDTSPIGRAAVFGVVLDAQHVYWHDGRSRLWRASKQGGDATQLVSKDASHFVILGDTIYYAAGRAIRKVPTSGGASSEVIKESEDPIVLVSDGRSLFYSMFDGSAVRQLDLGSGKIVRRFPITGKQVTLALDAGQLYVASYGTGSITRWPIAGGAPKVLVRGERTLVGVSVDDAAIYYSVEKGGFIKRLPKRGGAPKVLASGCSNQEAIYLDGRHAYWFDWKGGFGKTALWRTLRDGSGQPEQVMTGLCSSHHLAFDGTDLFIENGAAGVIVRVPRPAR
jgi:hypothetical protein